MRHLLYLLLTLLCYGLSAQEIIVFGADNHDNIKVTASSSHNESFPYNIINGSGKDARSMAAARFLAQSTLGFKMEDVLSVQESGEEAWIENEFQKPVQLYRDELEKIWAQVYQMRIDGGLTDDQIFGPLTEHFNYAWWQNVIVGEDLLRHRIALALSQILVVSSRSDLGNYANAMASYYDVLYKNAFGNYLDLLMEVTLHPAMGYYLSHLNNPKANDANVIRPDENFAREVMQLFTIGLHQLNNNGTVKLTADGRPLPTYDAEDIRELAQVFTGLGAGAVSDLYPQIPEPYFGLGFWGVDHEVPMVMYNDHHDLSSKVLIGGLTLPPNQDGMKDIEDAVRHLFDHPNVGPFVCRQLIQSLVKSNPSPAYITRVVSAFNNNGDGIRGDLKAVIKAILLDEEARSCQYMLDPDNGKLREPIIRYTQLCKSFDLISPKGRYWDNGFGHLEWTGQMPLSAPSVFNFFEPDFKPNDLFEAENLNGPEYQILNSKTAIGYLNKVNAGTIWDNLIESFEVNFGDDIVKLDLTPLEPNAVDIERIINYFDILLTNGQLTDETRRNIANSASRLLWGDVNYHKVRMALYGIMISPDYVVFK